MTPSQSSPAKPLAPTTVPLCLKHLRRTAGTSAGCDGNKTSSCSQLTYAHELPDGKVILGLCHHGFFFACPVLRLFTSSSRRGRNRLGTFSRACASGTWKIVHHVAQPMGSAPAPAPNSQTRQQAPGRGGHGPAEIRGCSIQWQVMDAELLPTSPIQLLFYLWPPH